MVLGRAVVALILFFGIWFFISHNLNATFATIDERIENKIENKLNVDIPAEFTFDCVVNCCPFFSGTRHAIELVFQEKEFHLLIQNLNTSASQGIVDIWTGCDRGSGILLSAFVEFETRRLFYDHGTLTRGFNC